MSMFAFRLRVAGWTTTAAALVVAVVADHATFALNLAAS